MKFKQSSPDPNASMYKTQRTFWICKPVEEILQKKEWNGTRSRLVDFLLCDFFGISYEQAYGRKASRHGKEQKLWDMIGIYRKADIVLGTDRKQMTVSDLKLLLQAEGKWPEESKDV
jgi:hypothetical protein